MFHHSLCITPLGAKHKKDTGNSRISEFLYRLPHLLRIKVTFLQFKSCWVVKVWIILNTLFATYGQKHYLFSQLQEHKKNCIHLLRDLKSTLYSNVLHFRLIFNYNDNLWSVYIWLILSILFYSRNWTIVWCVMSVWLLGGSRCMLVILIFVCLIYWLMLYLSIVLTVFAELYGWYCDLNRFHIQWCLWPRVDLWNVNKLKLKSVMVGRHICNQT